MRDILVIRGLVRPKRILRLQSSAAQQMLKFIRRKRLLPHVIDAFEFNPFLRQDPLDLSAFGSSWLLVNDDLGSRRHFFLQSVHEVGDAQVQSMEHMMSAWTATSLLK